VADIIRSAVADFIARNRHWLRWTDLKVLLAIARRRTAHLAALCSGEVAFWRTSISTYSTRLLIICAVANALIEPIL
jgi:hypothetical protein